MEECWDDGWFEVFDVKEVSTSEWDTFKDFIWSVTPGYAWTLGRVYTVMLGLEYGYSLGNIQILPRVNFVLLL